MRPACGETASRLRFAVISSMSDERPRRSGDVAEVYADPALAHRLLGWRAQLDLDAMCRDAWRWQSMNPDGFAGMSSRRSDAVGGGEKKPEPMHLLPVGEPARAGSLLE